MTLVLFDIDGTLLRSGGSGRGAMAQAAGELYGRFDMFDDLSFAGAVDSSIVAQALWMAGILPTPRRVGRLRARYVRRLTRSLQQSTGELCAGVPEVVPMVRRSAEIGLLTGNWFAGAKAKLQAHGLWGHFDGCVGAYGGDASMRNDLVPVAVHRARRRLGNIDRVVVIGDTPADVNCAKAGQAALKHLGVEVLSVAVETGFSRPEALRQAGPDLQLKDFVCGQQQLLELVCE